jgi:hypothetical protein
MTREFNFKFDELVIDYKKIVAILGYTSGPLPAPFNYYLEQALTEAKCLTDIRGCYRVMDDPVILEKEGKIVINDQLFNVGKTLCKELHGSERLAFFVCTAGNVISQKSEILLHGDDPVLGYVYDVLGSSIVESVGDRLQSILQQEMQSKHGNITNRYSPGYCQWSVADQHKLFSIFQGNTCGVSLTASALMTPVKSISGVIGIGKSVKYREYTCTLCSGKGCIYRKIRDGMQIPLG